MGCIGIWEYLSNSSNGVREVLIIMSVEWAVFLVAAYYLDQVISSGTGNSRNPLFLPNTQKKPLASFQKPSSQSEETSVHMEDNDVLQEREKVEQLLNRPHPNYSAVCYNLKKMYPGKDGNPDKVAVKELSLALLRGECFGMLGANGAGKTTFIRMMTGPLEPSSGTAYIKGLDLRTQMNEIFGSMGVCPQHVLLWDTLLALGHPNRKGTLTILWKIKKSQGCCFMPTERDSGRPHQTGKTRIRYFVNDHLSAIRLSVEKYHPDSKPLGHMTRKAVQESLKSFNLSQGGVGDKASGKYSGGMRRRLSVAISLIGDPKVVYMDEPSTELDPASKKMLWDVVKRAKQDRAIILTTHSMDEAEYLCDRIGIFVDGNFQCLGNADELKARYGGSYMFTMTTSPEYQREEEVLVKHLSPNAKKTYHLYGTQKFELPKDEAKISDVFLTVKLAKQRFTVLSWGLADTTLEDVFIKVATEAQ